MRNRNEGSDNTHNALIGEKKNVKRTFCVQHCLFHYPKRLMASPMALQVQRSVNLTFAFSPSLFYSENTMCCVFAESICPCSIPSRGGKRDLASHFPEARVGQNSTLFSDHFNKKKALQFTFAVEANILKQTIDSLDVPTPIILRLFIKSGIYFCTSSFCCS